MHRIPPVGCTEVLRCTESPWGDALRSWGARNPLGGCTEVSGCTEHSPAQNNPVPRPQPFPPLPPLQKTHRMVIANAEKLQLLSSTTTSVRLRQPHSPTSKPPAGSQHLLFGKCLLLLSRSSLLLSFWTSAKTIYIHISIQHSCPLGLPSLGPGDFPYCTPVLCALYNNARNTK